MSNPFLELYPNTGPLFEQQQMAFLPLLEQLALKGLFSLLIKLNMNELRSVTKTFLELHSFSANPPNTFPLVVLIRVNVFGILSQLK
jgi:hypothetical protein